MSLIIRSLLLLLGIAVLSVTARGGIVEFLPRPDLESRDPWQAAVHYCVAARHGNTEAQYRLGVLYAFGLGVPENRQAAASLFSIAAEQGHRQAQDMLDTILLKNHQLPACLLADVQPEKSPLPHGAVQRITLSHEQKKTARIIAQIARWHGVDPDFALSIALVESRLQTYAVSPKSAMGVMQLIPGTAARFNVQDVFNVSQNVKGGVRYLRLLLDRYQGRIDLVSAAYNAGEGAVDRYRGIPPYKETRQYVIKIQRLYPSLIHIPDRERYAVQRR
ncbi:lytic transglycosylase domain-containing protein [Chitinibacter sp. GC72]|uniref:lytic transglycosylase domain-containing protein n=1 Tax=Chitinibacter sp. GC72 TaxID=1526917 RepID=UPI0012FAF582|nr:lytic transglycosylase domain-containing protein [Chitinibacter sp. GC72]